MLRRKRRGIEPEGIQAKNVEMFKQFAAVTPSKRKRCYFRFLAGPVELIGNGRVEGVVLEKNALSGPANNQSARGTGEKTTLPCGILFRSIGYNGIAMPGVPFDERKGVIPNTDGRVNLRPPPRQPHNRPGVVQIDANAEHMPYAVIGRGLQQLLDSRCVFFRRNQG